MECLLVTGAEGFVGRWALTALRDRYPRAALVAATRSGETVTGASSSEQLDVTHPEAVRTIVDRVRPDGVLHLAGIAAVRDAEADERLAYEVNLHGTLNLLRALEVSAPEARLVHVSSADVYGGALQTMGRPVDEDAAIAPLNAYALSKAAGDLAVGAAAARGRPAVRMRPFNHTGPGQDSRFVVSAFARQIAEIEAGVRAPVMKVGSLTAVREFIDVRDVARAYALAFDAPASCWTGTIINLSGGQLVRIGDLLDLLRSFSAIPIVVEQDAALTRPDEPAYSGGDATRAAQLLGWHAEIPLETTLRNCLAFWRGEIR